MKYVPFSAIILPQSDTALAVTTTLSAPTQMPLLSFSLKSKTITSVGILEVLDFYIVGIMCTAIKQAFSSSTWFVYRCNYVHCVDVIQ